MEDWNNLFVAKLSLLLSRSTTITSSQGFFQMGMILIADVYILFLCFRSISLLLWII